MSFSHSSAHNPAHLRFTGVSKSFPDRRVLTDITFTVSSNDVVGLIGENGSGKTTLLRIAAGLLEPDAGTIEAVGRGGRTLTGDGAKGGDTRTLGVTTPSVRAASGKHGTVGADTFAQGTVRIGLLHQEPPFPLTATVHEALETAVAPVRAAEQELADASAHYADHPGDPGATERYTHALESAEYLNVWSLDTEIGVTLAALGLSALPPDRLTRALSGGQRARLSLAWLLLSKPDVLLLDEPTNHLDDGAVAFLHKTLKTWAGPVLLASHDRAFLDEAIGTLIDLDPVPRPHSLLHKVSSNGPTSGVGVTRFSGNYSDYLIHRRTERARWELQFRDEQTDIKRMRAAVTASRTVGHTDWKPRTESRIAQKFYGDRNATVVSRRVNDAQRRLATLEEEQIARPPRTLTFRGLTEEGGAPPEGVSLAVTSLSVSGRLAPTSFALSSGEKLLVTGENGSGKSTLLKVIAGYLEPTLGSVHMAGSPTKYSGNGPHPRPSLSQAHGTPLSPERTFPKRSGPVGLLSQELHIPDPLDRGPSRTAVQAYVDILGSQIAHNVPLASLGLFDPRDLTRPLLHLSVGQQRRLELALLLADPPPLLLLDEPTNHLSLSLVTALEEQIPSYPGIVIVASHDRWLRRSWAGKVLGLQ